MKKPILILAICCVLLTGCNSVSAPTNTNLNVNPPITGSEAGCLNSGGTITISQCCSGVGDFPNNCLIGACGCSAQYSHPVKGCQCGENQCFNGSKCASNQPQNINLNY